MCRTLLVIALAALAHDAYADAKTQKLTTGYQREARNCKIQSDGVTKVLEGATALQAEGESVEADVAKLKAASEPIQAYCNELAAMIDMLKEDPAASYKSLEPQISERDKKIRELRKAFKQAADGVTPIIRKLVPRINKRNANAGPSAPKPEPAPAPAPPPAPAPRPVSTTPPPPPPPSMTMKEGPTTSLSMHAFTGGTCDEQAKQLDKKTDREPPKKRMPGTLAWLPNARWTASYVSGDRFVHVECVQTKGGGMVLTLEGPNQPRADRELLDVAVRALAVSAR